VDESGRTCILRVVEPRRKLKVPVRGALRLLRRLVRLDGRSPLPRPRSHFRRLRDWGMLFNPPRGHVEAVEHRGPGEYDRDYLDFLEAVIARGAALGLRFVVDFHQDA